VTIFTLNAGSNSLKFEIVTTNAGGRGEEQSRFGLSVIVGAYDNIEKEHSVLSLLENKQPRHNQQMEIRDHGHATDLLFE
jgi:acetate kinase